MLRPAAGAVMTGLELSRRHDQHRGEDDRAKVERGEDAGHGRNSSRAGMYSARPA